MMKQTPTAAQAEAIHLAADEADYALLAAESLVDNLRLRRKKLNRAITEAEYRHHQALAARNKAIAASAAIRP